MTSLRFVNAFDLLGEDETDDVTILYERMQIKGVQEVAISEITSEKVEKAEVSKPETNKEENGSIGHVNGTENGATNGDDWNTVPKKVYGLKKFKRAYKNNGWNYNDDRRGYGNGQLQSDNANADGSEQPKSDGHVSGNGNDNNDNSNGEVKEMDEACKEVASDNASNGGDANVITESDAGITVELSNGEEVIEKEETAEERKARESEEELKKQREESRKRWEEEQAKEASKMTLAEYEKIRLAKKLALNEKKAEARRVFVADKDLESMSMLPKKQANDETSLVVPKKVSESVTAVSKKHANGASGSKTVVQLTKLFAPTSYRRSNNDGRGRVGAHSISSTDAQPINNVPGWFSDKVVVDEETEKKYKSFFPILGSVPSKAETAPKRVIKADPTPPASAPNRRNGRLAKN